MKFPDTFSAVIGYPDKRLVISCAIIGDFCIHAQMATRSCVRVSHVASGGAVDDFAGRMKVSKAKKCAVAMNEIVRRYPELWKVRKFQDAERKWKAEKAEAMKDEVREMCRRLGGVRYSRKAKS